MIDSPQVTGPAVLFDAAGRRQLTSSELLMNRQNSATELMSDLQELIAGLVANAGNQVPRQRRRATRQQGKNNNNTILHWCF